MNKTSPLLLKTSLAGIAFAAASAFAQSYESQNALDDEIRKTADELSFPEFESDTIWRSMN